MHSAASLPCIMSQRRGFSERMRELITEPISDAGLLERFASQRDEAAFGELVKRHGPQVLKVCRRGLPNEPGSANRSKLSLVRPSGLPSRPPIRTQAEAPNSGSSSRRRCAWRRSILAGRPGPAIGQPCWVRLDSSRPPASAATKSSGTRSSQSAVAGLERSRGIGSLPASAEFHKLQLFQDVWATIRASASGSRLLPRIE